MKKLLTGLLLTVAASNNAIAAESLTEALTEGKVSADLRLRYESVEQDNAVADADALTLRTRLAYTTGSYHGFSSMLEMEDIRIVGGVSDYTVGPTGFNPGQFSVIADPETTEVKQGFIQYKNNILTSKLGRQIITYDRQRFIGHVGWRQDRQSFDALSIKVTPSRDLALNYNYINQRNRIFAEQADLKSKDHLFNASYKMPIGKLTGYVYLLEVDNNTDNALDTYGISLKGSNDQSAIKFLYTAEYATQTSKSGSTEFDADYLFLEGGVITRGITTKLAYEVLGSDNASYGFSTPLATVHKFNGWSDQFLATPPQGLVDTYISVSGKAWNGKWVVAYHDFNADESTSTVDDLGSEINLLYAKKFAKHYNAGIKYASYSAGDAAAGKVDTDKIWLWVGATF